jgi:hypothetical protein
MNRRVRSMNLQLDRALLRRNMSPTDVTDTSSIAREDYTMQGLHLHSQGKKMFTQLTAERVAGGHVSGISSIPVITHAKALPFLA